MTPGEAIARARGATAGDGPVILADVQDNPGAGGTNDTTGLLAALVAAKAEGAGLAHIGDQPAVDAAHAAGVGVTLDLEDTPTLFGEDQARYLVACSFDKAEALMIAAGQAGVPIQTVGRFTGQDVRFGSSGEALDTLSALFDEGFAQALA